MGALAVKNYSLWMLLTQKQDVYGFVSNILHIQHSSTQNKNFQQHLLFPHSENCMDWEKVKGFTFLQAVLPLACTYVCRLMLKCAP